MIVRHADGALLCIRQSDHAALSGRLAEAWAADGVPNRPTRERLIAATAQHDVGWTTEDEALRFDPATHAPHDFITIPVEARQAAFFRGVDALAARDPYAAGLVAQHGLTVYRRYQHDAEWRSFFPILEQRRDDLCANLVGRSGASPFTFLQDYTILGLCDLCSLVFCSGWREPHLMEGYEVMLEGTRLVISPDPFSGIAVELAVPARRLPGRPFWSQADLDEAWRAAEPDQLTGLAVGRRPAS